LRILQGGDEKIGVDCPLYDKQIGTALLRTHECEKARPHLARAFKRQPDDHALRGDLMIALASSGRTAEAMSTYESRPAEFDESSAWDTARQQAFGKALRAQALKEASKGAPKPVTCQTYATGLSLSAIEVPLYDEAIQFYNLAGMIGVVEKLKFDREELMKLCEKSVASSQQRKAESQARLEQIRTRSHEAVSQLVASRESSRRTFAPTASGRSGGGGGGGGGGGKSSGGGCGSSGGGGG
jgi:uncharacterized membrane protein YgcG